LCFTFLLCKRERRGGRGGEEKIEGVLEGCWVSWGRGDLYLVLVGLDLATKVANIPYVPSLEKEMRGRGDEVGDGLSHRALSRGSEGMLIRCAYVNTIGEMA
jgi:hypothetical protein